MDDLPTFLLRGLLDLANGDQGVCNVYELPDGSIRTEFDPPRDLLAALECGDPNALQIIFLQHGFGPVASKLLADRLVRRKRGRPRLTTPEQLYERRLAQIRSDLRKRGERAHVQQKAMATLEDEHRQCCEYAVKHGLEFSELDSIKLANYLRRSKQQRKKSRT
jgi:hypothetical protein